MDVTNEMLEAAMRKAVEAGLLPRHASRDDMQINRELIRVVLQAALASAPERRTSYGAPPARWGVVAGGNGNISPTPTAGFATYRYFAK